MSKDHLSNYRRMWNMYIQLELSLYYFKRKCFGLGIQIYIKKNTKSVLVKLFWLICLHTEHNYYYYYYLRTHNLLYIFVLGIYDNIFSCWYIRIPTSNITLCTLYSFAFIWLHEFTHLFIGSSQLIAICEKAQIVFTSTMAMWLWVVVLLILCDVMHDDHADGEW